MNTPGSRDTWTVSPPPAEAPSSSAQRKQTGDTVAYVSAYGARPTIFFNRADLTQRGQYESVSPKGDAKRRGPSYRASSGTTPAR